MRLKLKNINKIKEADVRLNGLTVIAGVNDSGKSTVGKVLYSVVKTIRNTRNYSEEKQQKEIASMAFQLYIQLQQLERGTQVNIKSILNLPQTLPEFREEIAHPETLDKSFFEEGMKRVSNLELSPRNKANISRKLQKLYDELFGEKDSATLFKKNFSQMVEAEFLGKISSIEAEESIILYDDESEESPLEISLKKDNVKSISFLNLSDFNILDATFIESPLYLHIFDALMYATTLSDAEKERMPFRPTVNAHVKDMAQKLGAFRFAMTESALKNEPIDDLEKITHGKFVYDKNVKQLVWEKDGKLYAPVNVASGIKSFGVLQMLLETEAIDSDKILIWDEPENHLHPEWQIHFAQILVALAKAGIPILVTSHSPYFIQAVRYHAVKAEIDKYVNYYLSEETENGLIRLDNVTNDLNRVFRKLANPMNDIINIGL